MQLNLPHLRYIPHFPSTRPSRVVTPRCHNYSVTNIKYIESVRYLLQAWRVST